ncbi:hypothetical protein KDK_30850 [Dictyobacter kobayashii]|uniref:Uncharacterized protein n=1 Tax=Dictyobacter kobayashii TaxID=2014872 RepID=A0A402AJQ1_9CHLR|nr:hypothetical protein KDK_30850 [Dictyobacter kobayashii]
MQNNNPVNATIEKWPALPFEDWKDTCETLHLWTQIVGKVRLQLSPPVNHWWHVPLYICARGLTTSPIPYQHGDFEITFDFIDHNLSIVTSEGSNKTLPLYPRSVANFYQEFMAALHALGIQVTINLHPCEIPNAIPFNQDLSHDAYDAVYVERFWHILCQIDTIFKEFRGRFIGKCSPVHFFWGSFDLAVTRFSGRKAPERKGADSITREAYSHEVISCGFWPGIASSPKAAFYAYAARNRLDSTMYPFDQPKLFTIPRWPKPSTSTTTCDRRAIPSKRCWISSRALMTPPLISPTGIVRHWNGPSKSE